MRSKILNLLLVFSLPQSAVAALITYRDDKGTTHVVQSIDEIPEQYRNRTKKISGSKKEFDLGHASITKVGENYFVEADFGEAGMRRMQIDLKVSFTTISPEIAQALKLPKVDRATIETTSGNTGHFPMVIVPKIVLAGYPVQSLKVVSAPGDGKEGSAGRLGQSFFNAFTVKIDEGNSEIFLIPKKKK